MFGADERLSRTGDGQVFCRTSMFNSLSAGLWAKWLQNLEDSQGDAAGNIPPTAPHTEAMWVNDGSPAWADAAVIVPWTVYQ